MPPKKRSVPDQLTNKWKISPLQEEKPSHSSTLNVPPKLEECLMNWSLEKTKNSSCSCHKCHKISTRSRDDMDIEVEIVSTAPPRPRRPTFGQIHFRQLPQTTFHTNEANLVPMMVNNPQSNSRRVVSTPVRISDSTTLERRNILEPFSYSVISQDNSRNEFSMKNIGVVPHSLNLEHAKQEVEKVLIQKFQNHSEHLPPVQELFQTADRAQAPNFLTNELEERRLLNTLNCHFMYFPSEQQHENLKEEKKEELGDSPPIQRHTI